MKVAGSTAEYDVAGTIYTFFNNGKYSRENRTGKTQGTWKCDTQGFVELDGKQKLGKPFQWKPSPTEEEVRDGKQLLRYGMMGDFVKKVQETLGFTGTALDSKFGGNTLKAVKDFQRKNDLEDDGLVGEKTYAAMFRKPAEKTQSAQPKGSQSVLPQKPTSGVQRTANIPTSTTTSNTTVADTGLDFS
jgi:peptidoglycan hydrolase-like protein with peptidoglycan-binding domain